MVKWWILDEWGGYKLLANNSIFYQVKRVAENSKVQNAVNEIENFEQIIIVRGELLVILIELMDKINSILLSIPNKIFMRRNEFEYICDNSNCFKQF